MRGSRQTAVPLRGELLATPVEVQVRQGERIGQVLPARAFQDPQQQGGQVRTHALGRAGRAQQLAAGDLAAQEGIAAIEQLAADRCEEVEMTQQIRDASLAAVRHRLGTRAARIAQHRQRVAAGRQGALDGRAQLALVLRSDADRVQHPARPAGQAQEGAALALVAGGVDVQGIAMAHGGVQGRGPLPVQGLQSGQEAIAQRGHGTGRECKALAGQSLADLLALEVAEIAGRPDPHDQVVAEALAGRGQLGQLPGDGDRVGAGKRGSAGGSRGPVPAGASGGSRAPFFGEAGEFEAVEDGLDLGQPDGRGVALQAPGDRGRC